jgi:CRP-like cAMP-binding protein
MQNKIRENIENKMKQTLTDEEFELFNEWLVPIQIDKKVQIVFEGKICNYLYFIESGILHSFITDTDGENHSIQFGFDDYWISDLYSFLSGKPALFNIEALVPTNVYAIKYANFEKACSQIPKFEHFFRILIQNAYVHSQQRIAKNFSEDAEHRYLTMLQQQPILLQKIPQYLIASYLGIKPQSLSRIRQNISKK